MITYEPKPMPSTSGPEVIEPGRRLFTRPFSDEPIEVLWKRGFLQLRDDLRALPEVLSAWAYWEQLSPSGEGFWRVMVVIDTPSPSPSLAPALCRWSRSAEPGTLLDWFVRTKAALSAANMDALKGRLVYRRGDSAIPEWIEALRPPQGL